MAVGINLGIVVVILGIWYALISEGLWGAALMFFNVLFSALIAFNFYEPLAALLAENVEAASGYADTGCLLGLFLVSLVIFRLTTESIAPGMVRFPMPVYHVGRIFFALATSMLTMSILLLAFETSPVDKKVFGVMDYKFKPPFGMALDRQWLAFFQYTTAYVFADHSNEAVDRDFGRAKAFDPRGSWLIDHQNSRPYGESVVPEREGGSAPASSSSGGAGGGGGGQGGGAPPPQSGGTPYGQGGGGQGGGAPPPQSGGTPYGQQGGSQTSSNGQMGSGTTIGGTAGAAVGVTPN